MSETKKVFVYGTLKRGYGNHRLMRNARFISEAVTGRKFQLQCNGGFPSLFNSTSSAGKVIGEVYEVGMETLESLDTLEGVSCGMYSRESIVVKLVGCESGLLRVDTYFRNPEAISSSGDVIEPAMGMINWNGPMKKKTV